MTLKNSVLLFVNSLVLLLTVSCHALVEDEFGDFERKPVLNGTLQADSIFRVQVTFTANLKDSVPPPVENAIVIIESTINSPDTLSYTQKGWYESTRKVKMGTAYKCIVNISGYELVTAETNVPYPTEIKNVQFTDFAGMDNEGEKISSCQFTISNNTAQNLFWEVRMIEEGVHKLYNWETKEWYKEFGVKRHTIFMEPGQDIVLLNEANPITFFSNKMMGENSYGVIFYHSEQLLPDYNHYIELRSVDKSYYEFQKQYYLYYTADYEQIGSSSQNYPLYSNVTNGLGIFTAYSVTRWKIEL